MSRGDLDKSREELEKEIDHLRRQIDILSSVIMKYFPEKIIHGGACDVAAAIIREYYEYSRSMKKVGETA